MRQVNQTFIASWLRYQGRQFAMSTAVRRSSTRVLRIRFESSSSHGYALGCLPWLADPITCTALLDGQRSMADQVPLAEIATTRSNLSLVSD